MSRITWNAFKKLVLRIFFFAHTLVHLLSVVTQIETESPEVKLRVSNYLKTPSVILIYKQYKERLTDFWNCITCQVKEKKKMHGFDQWPKVSVISKPIR